MTTTLASAPVASKPRTGPEIVEGLGQGPNFTTRSSMKRERGAMDVTKAYEIIGFGAMDVTKPYEITWFC